MSMTPIVDSGFTFSISSLAKLGAVLTTDALASAFQQQAMNYGEAWERTQNPYAPGLCAGPVQPTISLWANMLAASGPAASSQIPADQIRAVLALALTGGGMTAQAATDAAERLHRGQLNRHFDFIAAQIVNAVVAAGV